MVGSLLKRVASPIAGGAAILSVLLIGGCENGYPTDLSYPLRSDLLVLTAPTDQPVYPDPPGELERFIAASVRKDSKAEALDPARLTSQQRDELRKGLAEAFGKPSRPKVADFDDSDAAAAVEELKLDEATLARGAELYRRHCLHCHGLTGDGRGASGAWLNPHPRDYRQGLFKFVSSGKLDAARKPRRADLYRTIHAGIEGTSMPAFNLLPGEEIDAIVSYVIHLSVRGQVEFITMRDLINNEPLENESVQGHVEKWTKLSLGQWASSNKVVLRPAAGSDVRPGTAEHAAAVARGYRLFTDPQGEASCIACHIDFGRQVPFRFDAWGTLVRPANLTQGVYRGGRRPIDLFWRVKGGIAPSGMPAAASLTDEQVWDIVHFLQALPHPRMLPDSVRDKVYVPAHESRVAAR